MDKIITVEFIQKTQVFDHGRQNFLKTFAKGERVNVHCTFGGWFIVEGGKEIGWVNHNRAVFVEKVQG